MEFGCFGSLATTANERNWDLPAAKKVSISSQNSGRVSNAIHFQPFSLISGAASWRPMEAIPCGME